MKQLGLLIRLIIGIIAGILIGMCGQWFGIADTAFFVTIIRLLATFTSLFSTFLSFMIPLIILSFITVGMAELGKKANRLFGLTLLLAYGTTVISGLLTFFIGKAVLPGLIQPITGDVLESNAFEPLFSITVDPIFGVMTALVLAFVLGIITAVLIRNRLNRFWELTPLILFLKELLVRLRGRCEVVREAAELGLRGRHEQRGCGDRGDGVPPPADDARAIARADEHELWALGGTVNVDDSKALDLGELIVGFLYFMGFEFNYITTGASADWGFFNRVMVGER